MEQALRTCLLAMRLGERLGLSRQALADVYYVALLRFIGCTADAHEAAAIANGDELHFRAAVAPALAGPPLEFARHALGAVASEGSALHRLRAAGALLSGLPRLRTGVAAHCEMAETLARRLGLPATVQQGLVHALERWDGTGLPGTVKGDAVALSARIAFVARDAEVLYRSEGLEAALATIRRRSGAAYDPAVVDALAALSPDLPAMLTSDTPWQEVMDAEPAPHVAVAAGDLDRALEVFADFVDLKSVYTLGHSRGVAALAERAAARLPVLETQAEALRRAGLLHDLGRIGIANGVWEKPGRLTEPEWERVRLHAYYTERILARSGVLAPLAPVAGMHHERQDGSGYHRSVGAAALTPAARLLAAVDAYQAMTQPRAHRPAMEPAQAAAELTKGATRGQLDQETVRAVLEAAGQAAPSARHTWPAGLSDREVEVLRLLCRGETKRQIATQLTISPSTADHHVRHIYEKLGVSTRAGAALFALQHGLLPE